MFLSHAHTATGIWCLGFNGTSSDQYSLTGGTFLRH